jgi:hypothetical protein
MNELLFQNEQTITKEKWKDEWKNMPEFIQEKQEPFAKIIIRFDNQDALDDFANLISQKLTNKTKSIWHPFKSHWGADKKVYVNES